MNITIIGLGYVGMVAAVCLADAGHRVLGVDINADRIEQLRAGQLPFYDPGLQNLVSAALNAGRLRLEHRDYVAEPLGELTLVATGTPQTPNGAADLSQVRSALAWIRSQVHDDTVVVMKSTVPPGTGQRIIEQDGRNQDRTASGIRYVSNRNSCAKVKRCATGSGRTASSSAPTQGTTGPSLP